MTGRVPADRVAIVGAGRAGRGLARALRASGVNVRGLSAHRADADDPDGAVVGGLSAIVADATVVFVAVQDHALAAALVEVAASGPRAGAAVLQLSGSASDAVLDPLRARGFPAGTFHPLVPLADPAVAASLFRDAWVGVGGDAAAVAAAERMAGVLGAHTLPIPREGDARARYHAAAVIASNFPVALVALAERLFVAAGVDGAAARAATWHLLQSAVTNLHGSSPRDALTGPVARGDEATIARHLAALAHDGAARDAYVCLTHVLREERAPATAGRR